MIIGLCSDHAGFQLKEHIKAVLDKKDIAYHDFGTHSADSCDYPDYAHPLAVAVEEGKMRMGIACCGSGNGINIVLNKHRGIRSALCWTEEVASLARQHNDANVLALPARFISEAQAECIINTFLSSSFEGGRHQKRIDKIPMS